MLSQIIRILWFLIILVTVAVFLIFNVFNIPREASTIQATQLYNQAAAVFLGIIAITLAGILVRQK